MRAGCLLVIWGVIRQLTERKGINNARPKRRQAWRLRARTCGVAAGQSVGGAKRHAPPVLDRRQT
jgi:hypothetical protein